MVEHFHHAVPQRVEPIVESQRQKRPRRLASRWVLADHFSKRGELEVLLQCGEVAGETLDRRSDVEVGKVGYRLAHVVGIDDVDACPQLAANPRIEGRRQGEPADALLDRDLRFLARSQYFSANRLQEHDGTEHAKCSGK